jgi:uncharacterized protein (DUF4213/DUF364 family)
MIEPLFFFYNNIVGFDKSEIKKIAIGAKYVAVLLNNGNIGVCATLGVEVSVEQARFKQPDLLDPYHRIIYNAYLNAKLNYKNSYNAEKDIFDQIDFSPKENIVMVGYFEPLVKKFQEAQIELAIFDKVIIKDEMLIALELMDEYLAEARKVILTSTTIAHATFDSIIHQTSADCDILILGPSSILDPHMLNYRNVKNIFGAVFEKNDHRILKVIQNGKGTKTFLPFGSKVYI